ncbi:MAG: L-rhamnose mutarotase [Pedobacter sp.]|nr:MAG: L-rhamnose mutarotase [Pedobacter sp.]
MDRYCFTLDLKDDQKSISTYKSYHRSVWPEVKDCLKEVGVLNLEIYLVANRLFMIMEVDDDFSFEEKNRTDAANIKVQEWEKLMWNFQKGLPWAKPGEKWVMMDQIFEL